MTKFRVHRERESKLYSAFKEIKEAATNLSHDPKTQVGAAILDPLTLRVVATSVNGFIPKAQDHLLPNVSPWKHGYMRHAERNLIGFCAKKGIAMEDHILIVTHSPCYECARALWDAGINTIIFEIEHKMTRENFAGKLDLTYAFGELDPEMFEETDCAQFRVMITRTKTEQEVMEGLKELAENDNNSEIQ